MVLGIIAGFSGGWVDTIIGRLIDLLLCFPQTLMCWRCLRSALTVLTGPPRPRAARWRRRPSSSRAGALRLAGTARLIRGQVLTLREREFVDAARLLGASRRRIWFKELLPNLWAPILVSFTLILPAFVSAEAALSYLGVSIQPPTPTLGNILRLDPVRQRRLPVLHHAGFLLALIVVSFNLLGDGLRDALDPKANR